LQPPQHFLLVREDSLELRAFGDSSARSPGNPRCPFGQYPRSRWFPPLVVGLVLNLRSLPHPAAFLQYSSMLRRALVIETLLPSTGTVSAPVQLVSDLHTALRIFVH